MYFKSLKIAGMALVGFSLAACSHSNPMAQYSRSQQAQDLMASAQTAELKLGLVKRRFEGGVIYFQCMNHIKKDKTCDAVYHAMQNNLREKYSGIEVSDISNQKHWSYIRDYYQEAMFTRLPE